MAAVELANNDFKLGRVLQLGSFRCEIEKLIYSGPFSQVFEISVPTLKPKFVLKISNENRFIRREIRALQMLSNVDGFPQLYFAGQTEDYSFSVMNLFGRSLQSFLDSSRFSMGTSLKIAQQTLGRLRTLHDFGILHRDIKPDNFVVGNSQSHVVYAIDLGFCRPFRKNDKTIKDPRRKGPMVGTDFYGSLAANAAQDQGPRDELESWLYMIMYISSSSLPWGGLPRKHVIDYKISIHERPELLDEKHSDFKEIFELIIATKFQEEPDYDKIQTMLLDLMDTYGIDRNEKLDWSVEELEDNNTQRQKNFIK
ncbi:unnamed protein product [Auanema sp. JU1783]|nr:unnamed protein product [Auanema sp. JU1783]